MAYQGILFPDKAESLNDFKGYKVFLDHWNPLATELRTFFEGLALRRETRCLGVHGVQSSGKSLFARKLVNDLETTKKENAAGRVVSEQNNLWHRMTGGGSLSPDLIRLATINTDILHIEDDKTWTEQAKMWKSGKKDRYCIIIADNAERAYFRQALVQMTDVEFVQHGDTQPAIRLAAERFVALCRGELRGCLFLILTNNENFLLSFAESVESQHSGLMEITSLPLPVGHDKETIIIAWTDGGIA